MSTVHGSTGGGTNRNIVEAVKEILERRGRETDGKDSTREKIRRTRQKRTNGKTDKWE